VFDELRGGDTMAVLLLRSILRKMTGVDGVSFFLFLLQANCQELL
jgi:hypothetical protein